MAFRSFVWDPFLLVVQMAAMQCLFYASLCVCVATGDWVFGTQRSLDQIFAYKSLYVRDLGGAKLLLSYLASSCVCALGLWQLVQRSKLCLDFAATISLWHIAFAWLVNGAVCTYVSWWLFQIVCVAICTVFAEYLCLQTEMKAIPLSMTPTTDL